LLADRVLSRMHTPSAIGPEIVSRVVDVYVFRTIDAVRAGPDDALSIELLQGLRVGGSLHGLWHPIMGHIEPGETAAAAAVREMREEAGLAASDPAVLGFWGLEQVHPFFLASRNEIHLSPRFAVRVTAAWSPVLNDEHSAWRWVRVPERLHDFVWPGQRGAVREILSDIAAGGPTAEALRLDLSSFI
jgi:dihydroneopterin triphosphate diphosphatase